MIYDVLETRIARIPRIDADDFLARFEILGNVGLGVWHWGLHDGDDLISVITFGTTCFGGKRGWIAKVAITNGVRVLQLCRGGTLPDITKGVPSRAISLACKAMRQVYGPFIAVAYADEALGEIGTIYQASGALYTGMTKPKGQANYLIDGKLKSAWQVRRIFGTRDRKCLAKIDPNIKVILLKPKHRYLFVCAHKEVKKRIMNALAEYIRPYPKRHLTSLGDPQPCLPLSKSIMTNSPITTGHQCVEPLLSVEK
ncbi:hypothetical protein SAMN05216316_2703 [Nitrosovibrio sp. Nv6]|nr:hypothetical protein SAMN05216316_2703 [Nitrosovibrio sp. Nv6]